MVLESIIVMLLWGSLFPAVKLGYEAFAIDTSFYPNLLMFAGLRFLVSGGILSCICLRRHERLGECRGKGTAGILGVGLFAVALHYSCTYIGLSVTDSSKTALMKQLGVLFFICFSFLFFKEDHFSVFNVICALLGLAGIIVLNVNDIGISFGLGESLIILSSVFSVASNIICKKYTAGIPPMLVTAYSQLFGGAVLTAAAFIAGGKTGLISSQSIGIFAYICIATCISYVLWNKNVQRGVLSKLFVIKFLEPLFATVFGAFLLKEDIFKIEYLIALLLILAAILISNIKPSSGK